MYLKDWWKAAKKHGTVYYVVDQQSRDGINGAAYSLYTIGRHDGKPRLLRAWPTSEEHQGFDRKLAKQLGFRVTRTWRAFKRNGCGYDRVQAIIADIAGVYGDKHDQQAVRLEGLHSW